MSANSNTFESESIRALLIEDDPAHARLIEHLIRRSPHPFEIEWVACLSMALERIAEGGLDIAVVDLGLPDSQGLATFDALQAADPFLPAVVMTSTDCEHLAIEAVRRGAQDYIVKGQHSGPTISRALRYAVERRRLEEQLRQSQKMETVGLLAGGVAHEFNNLLQAIIGHTRSAMEGLPAHDLRHRDLVKALNAADRAAGVTRQLLDFSRHDGPAKRETNVAELVADVAELVAPLLDDRWHLEIELPSEELTLIADAGMLQRMLMNLCINARDAMPDGGTIVIESREAQLSQASCTRMPAAVPGEYVVLSVRDFGCGVPPELRESFFSTKEPGQGIGFGLGMVHSIVKQHGGHLQVESTEGAGSTFAVYLPKCVRKSLTNRDAGGAWDVAVDIPIMVGSATRGENRLLLPQPN